MKTRLFSVVLALALTVGAVLPILVPVLAAPIALSSVKTPATDSKGLSPASMLNSDGTLKPDGSFKGTLDLSGYTVQMDPRRGPIFSAEASAQQVKAASVTPGNWAALGSGAGVFNWNVYAIAVDGTDVYVGGYFTNADNIEAADYVAMWDGANWNALGSNGAGNGSLNYAVYALALDASGNLYVGGSFTDVNNNGTVLTEADNIAKWDGTNWSALGNNGAGVGALNGAVSSLAIDGSGNLYAGGDFTNAAGFAEADYLAK